MVQSAVQERENEPIFSSKGNRRFKLDLFSKVYDISFRNTPYAPVIQRITQDDVYSVNGRQDLALQFEKHRAEAATTQETPHENTVAGKNTYTYDAHTYHTKVPPQGIVTYLKHYLPEGGLVLDPFSGSGMTGVASIASGYDVILNELSPAACFIANQFTTPIDPEKFMAGVDALLNETKHIREKLYSTQCRECGKDTEILYTVWSYDVECNHCNQSFTLWDHCRKYGNSVKEHKILSDFPCPHCDTVVSKSRLKRLGIKPVLVGYKCCSKFQTEQPPNQQDLELINEIEENPLVVQGFFPTNEIGDGVNLRQPKNHGINSIDKFYTKRNLSALSQLWYNIHKIEDAELAASLAFVFTSLYQRVTKLSEFRFWGGSGNSARFNVPHIFNEANVFTTFLRKAKSIQDHLETTAKHYTGKATVVNNSATDLSYIPDNSIDLVFTDPPFGSNINYSEMNILWESWLGRFTNSENEAIINKVQKKTINDYHNLMRKSLEESYRVLRPDHWMLLVFMNSSAEVWQVLKQSILDAGFELKKIDIFDKKHGTFKHFVSENTAGYDLVLHCHKSTNAINQNINNESYNVESSIYSFLKNRPGGIPKTIFLHVDREDSTDYRNLYSEWLTSALLENSEVLNFNIFRGIVDQWLQQNENK